MRWKHAIEGPSEEGTAEMIQRLLYGKGLKPRLEPVLKRAQARNLALFRPHESHSSAVRARIASGIAASCRGDMCNISMRCGCPGPKGT